MFQFISQYFTIQPINLNMKALLFALLCFYVTYSQTFQAFKAQMETKVRKIADHMSQIYASRCDDNIMQCEVKSYNQCEGTSVRNCLLDFPQASGCLDEGVMLSEQSAIRFPNSVNASELTSDERHFVCTSALLEDSFKELDTDRGIKYGIAYVGTTLGSFRAYPTFKQDQSFGQCTDYDPRYRPWYVTATSGGKNVILIIDTSGSMSGSRMSIAKDAAKSVVNTLSNNDFVGVVKFQNEAYSLVSEKMTRATIQYKENLVSSIGSLGAGGGTNYENAFRQAFRMLEQAQTDEFGPPCGDSENIFLFLTDGYPTQGANTSKALANVIDEYNSGFDITLFTYGMGTGADFSILYTLACQYNGIMYKIEDSASASELTTLMRSYYLFISEGIQISNPVWTQPYEDYFGFGRMVTVSMPIYYTEGGIRKILGAAGIDVTMQTFKDFGFEEELEITKRLISESPCLKSNLTACDLEGLRPSSSKCGLEDCSIIEDITACVNTVTRDIFLSPQDERTGLCCGMSVGALVGIIIGSVIGLGLVIGISVFLFRRVRS